LSIFLIILSKEGMWRKRGGGSTRTLEVPEAPGDGEGDDEDGGEDDVDDGHD